jgi:hypothetical protein
MFLFGSESGGTVSLNSYDVEFAKQVLQPYYDEDDDDDDESCDES